jgi:hypothetical protein
VTRAPYDAGTDSPPHRRTQWAASILRAIAIYSAASWVYIALVALVHPETLPLQLTHFTKWPHEDTYGEFSFVVSFLAFTGYSLIKSRRDQ